MRTLVVELKVKINDKQFNELIEKGLNVDCLSKHITIYGKKVKIGRTYIGGEKGTP